MWPRPTSSPYSACAKKDPMNISFVNNQYLPGQKLAAIKEFIGMNFPVLHQASKIQPGASQTFLNLPPQFFTCWINWKL